MSKISAMTAVSSLPASAYIPIVDPTEPIPEDRNKRWTGAQAARGPVDVDPDAGPGTGAGIGTPDDPVRIGTEFDEPDTGPEVDVGGGAGQVARQRTRTQTREQATQPELDVDIRPLETDQDVLDSEIRARVEGETELDLDLPTRRLEPTIAAETQTQDPLTELLELEAAAERPLQEVGTETRQETRTELDTRLETRTEVDTRLETGQETDLRTELGLETAQETTQETRQETRLETTTETGIPRTETDTPDLFEEEPPEEEDPTFAFRAADATFRSGFATGEELEDLFE